MKLKQTSLTLAVILSSAAFSFASPNPDTILIDDFTDGSNFTDSNTSGTASYNYLSTAPDILGGRRQVRSRAAGSGFYGPSAISVDVMAGTLSSYGGDNGDRFIQYGSSIGSVSQTGVGPGTPVNLDLNLELSGSINIDVANASSGDSLSITLFDSGGGQYNTSLNISSAGSYTVPLSSFSTLTSIAASDIDGIMFNPGSNAGSAATGLVLNDLSITVPEPTTVALAGLSCAGLFLFRRRK